MIEPRTVVALDVATVTGCAEIEPGFEPRFYSVRFASPGDEHVETFSRARRWIDARLSVGDVAALYVESTNLGALIGQTNADTIKRLVGLNAVISSAAGVWRVKYRKVDVHTARKEFLGNGRLKREEAKPRAMAMAKSIGWEPNNLDEADAASVLYFALCREAPNVAPQISPMDHHRIATAAENEKILREQEKRERGLRRIRA